MRGALILIITVLAGCADLIPVTDRELIVRLRTHENITNFCESIGAGRGSRAFAVPATDCAQPLRRAAHPHETLGHELNPLRVTFTHRQS